MWCDEASDWHLANYNNCFVATSQKPKLKRHLNVCIRFCSANTHANSPFQELNKINMVTIWRQLRPFKYTVKERLSCECLNDIMFLSWPTWPTLHLLAVSWTPYFISSTHGQINSIFCNLLIAPIPHPLLSLLLKMPQLHSLDVLCVGEHLK